MTFFENIFLVIYAFHRAPYVSPLRNNCFSKGYVSEFLSKPIATFDFLGLGFGPLSSPDLERHMTSMFISFFVSVVYCSLSMQYNKNPS